MNRFTLALVACIACHGGQSQADENAFLSVTVVMSSEKASKYEVLNGFKQHLSSLNIHADYDIAILSKNTLPEELHPHYETKYERLFLTLDTLASEVTLKQQPDAPVISALLLNTETIDHASNATGILLNHPIEVQLAWLNRILPDVSRVGVLFNPEENQQVVSVAQDLAQERGIDLIPEEVFEPRDLPNALRAMSKEAEMIWGIADRTVLAPETVQHLLVFSFRNRIPFSGLSENWVKAGALYALDRDYFDIGTQCGEIAVKILEGTTADEIPIAPARKVVYMLNLKTAQHMKLDISPEIIAGAEVVFE